MISEETQLKFGFKFDQAGAHSSRTIMLSELELLFDSLPEDATQNDYRNAILDENVLGKRTGKTRELTYRDLVSLYSLDINFALFRAFRRLWELDTASRPVLACQLALIRDPLLRQSYKKIQTLETGELHSREAMETHMSEQYPDRYSAGSLKSLSSNINASWTHAGYLRGRSKKYREEPVIRPANVVFALFAAYLQGATGNRLFISEWLKAFSFLSA